jgi:hypothetical protein
MAICQPNGNRQSLSLVRESDASLQAKVYTVFLEMRDLLEDFAPLWYPETLQRRAEGIVREYRRQLSCGKANALKKEASRARRVREPARRRPVFARDFRAAKRPTRVPAPM